MAEIKVLREALMRRALGLPGGSLVEIGFIGDLSQRQSRESILELSLALIFMEALPVLKHGIVTGALSVLGGPKLETILNTVHTRCISK